MSHDDIRAALEAWDDADMSGNTAGCVILLTAKEQQYLYEKAPGWLEELMAENERLTDDLDRLRLADDYKPEGVDIVMAKLRDHKRRAESAEQWKAEALPVIDGLQELGAALGIPLGKRITGPDALAAVEALTARAEAAERAIQRVRDLAKYLSGLAGGDRHYADHILRALDGGEQ